MANEEASQKQILKSTGIIGGSQVIIILVGIVRTKILALFLGPVGVGINGLYQSAIDFIKTSTSFGLQFSAVRDIAAAASTGDETRIATTIKVLRRWVWLTALLGGAIAIIFCKPISRLTFSDERYAGGVAAISGVIVLTTLAAGQSALLQGLRRIADMARSNVYGSLLSLVIAVPVYWMLGQRGILPVLLLTACATLFLSWYFVRRVPVKPVALSWGQTWTQGQAMIRLGFFMVLAGFVEVATGYVVRILIVKDLGTAGVGQFNAAWTISALYMSAVLNAMGADYFPRLSSVQDNPGKLRQMINEQTEIALLIACPLIVGFISFISIIVPVFYSRQFTTTPLILNWQLVGDFFKILSWPVSYAFLARGMGRTHIGTNLLWSAAYIAIAYGGWSLFGIEVSGMAFLCAYVLYLAVVLGLARKSFAFSWNGPVVRLAVLQGLLVLLAFLASRLLTGWYRYGGGACLTLAASAYSFVQLRRHMDVGALLSKITSRFRRGA